MAGRADFLSIDAEGVFRDLAKDLRAAGHTALMKDLTKQLKAAAKPIIPATRHAALATLPKRGGLARLVSKAPQRVVARAGNTTATVAVVVAGKKKGSGATQTDAGTVRHPVFNRKNAQGRRIFVAQAVRAGWFSRTAQFLGPDIERQVVRVLDDIARRAMRPAA